MESLLQPSRDRYVLCLQVPEEAGALFPSPPRPQHLQQHRSRVSAFIRRLQIIKHHDRLIDFQHPWRDVFRVIRQRLQGSDLELIGLLQVYTVTLVKTGEVVSGPSKRLLRPV